MAKLTISTVDPASLATPASGDITIFADLTDNNKPKYMTSDGNIHDFSGDSVLKIESLFSDFSGTGFESEVTLMQIPQKSILNFMMIEMTSSFLSPDFSDIRVQLFLRDVNGDADVRVNVLGGTVSPIEGMLLQEIVLSSVDSPNVGAQFTGNVSGILNTINPVDLIARLKVDSENLGTEASLTASYEVVDITTLPDVADSLTGKHFLLSESGTDYYVWYNTGTSVDPAVVGITGIQVDININDIASSIAYKTAVQLKNITGLQVYQFGDQIRCIDTSKANITDALEVTTGFTVTVITQGGGVAKVINDLIQGAFSTYIQFTKLL